MSRHPEGKVIKVMTDAEWAALSEDSRQNLITLFGYSQFPAPGDESLHNVRFDEREQKVLQEMMTEWDMSAPAVIRHLFRIGQSVSYVMNKNREVGFFDDQGDFVSIFGRHEPKMAPMPPENEWLDNWDNEGGQ